MAIPLIFKVPFLTWITAVPLICTSSPAKLYFLFVVASSTMYTPLTITLLPLWITSLWVVLLSASCAPTMLVLVTRALAPKVTVLLSREMVAKLFSSVPEVPVSMPTPAITPVELAAPVKVASKLTVLPVKVPLWEA